MRHLRGLALRSAAPVVPLGVAMLLTTACSSGAPGGDPQETRDGSAATVSASDAPTDTASAVDLPPVHAGFDYQIGGPYTPPQGVSVARDHTAVPAPGLYNVCYVNAFQAQPGAEREWDSDLLLRDGAGEVVMDEHWGEAVLDRPTSVNAWPAG